MLDSNTVIINEDVLLNLCNDILVENKKTDQMTSTNDTCIKMIDYLMF